MLKFVCPQCGEYYEVEDDWLGIKVSCESCSARFYVPRSGEAAMLAPPETNTVQNVDAVERSEETAPQSESKISISFDDIPSSLAHLNNVAPERKMSPRQRRLFADAKMMYEKFSTFQYIHVVEALGNPPEKYIVDYNVRGIGRLDGDRIFYRNVHRVEIKLPGTYPRTPPICKMLTPIFHPNIEPAVICIGDHWTAGERLCDLVIRIGEMITYQSYNIKSPLDGEAAMWADLHNDMLPIDNCDLFPPEN